MSKQVEELLSLQRTYQTILLNDGGIRTLCNTLSNQINNPVFILDKYREDILYIDQELCKQLDCNSYLEKREFKDQEIVYEEHGILLKQLTYSWAGQEYKEIQVKLKEEDQILGFLTILIRNQLEKDNYLSIIQGTYALSLKLHQNHLIRNLIKRSSNEFIEDLLQGKIKNREELIEKGELIGWDLTIPYQLFALQLNLQMDIYCEEGEESFYFYEIKERIIRNLNRIAKTYISQDHIVFSYDNKIILMINYSTKDSQIKADIEKIHQELKENFPKINILVGAGKFVTDCCFLAESYQQALYTLDFLAATERKNRVLFYEELGVLRLLWQSDYDELAQFANEFLGKLIEYNKDDSTEWMKTLGCFLTEGGSIQNAAEKLHIHPNTMSYRIKRIEEIMEIDLKDFEIQLNLAVAYKIYKFILPTYRKNDKQ